MTPAIVQENLFQNPLCTDSLVDAQRWAARFMFALLDFTGADWRDGFEASYFPLSGPGVLPVAQRSAAEYKDIFRLTGGVVAARLDLPVTPQLTALVLLTNSIPDPVAQMTFISQFVWMHAE